MKDNSQINAAWTLILNMKTQQMAKNQ